MITQTINPKFISHEGFTYLEFNGEFFKGCKRCGGEGHYSHNGEHSRCYECDNTSAKLGEHLADEAAAQKWCHERALRRAARERKREQERLAKVADMEANAAALKAEDEEVYNFLMGVAIEDDTQDQYETYEEWAQAQFYAQPSKLEKSSFIRAMAETLRWVGPSKRFTANMIAAVRKTMLERAEKDANAVDVPEGRYTLTGVVVKTKFQESDYGVTYKITLRDDRGFAVYGTLPTSLAEQFYSEHYNETVHERRWDDENVSWLEAVVGKRITFDAKVEASSDNKGFGFYSRPTKASDLTPAAEAETE